MNKKFQIFNSQILSLQNICLFLLLISSLIYMSNIKEVMDLTLYDEASQLKDGLNIKQNILPSAQASPIYSLWYTFISFFINNPIDIYYFNWHFLTIALPVCIYIFLLDFKLNPLVSFLVSIIFLYSRFNYPLWPKTNNFGLFLIIIIALMIRKTKFIKFIDKKDLYLFLFFIGSFLRPEFLISALVYFILNIYNFKIRLTLERLIYLSLSGLFIFLFGFPFGNRLTAAFGQHFTVNFVERNKLDVVAWDSYGSIIEDIFGGGNNIIDYLFYNPQAFLSHVLFNVKRIPISFLSYFKPYNEEPYIIAILLVCLLSVFFIIINFHRTKTLKRIFQIEKIRLALTNPTNKLLVSLIVPFLITASIIFPRGHYFLYLFLGLLTIIAYNLKDFINEPFEKVSNKIKIILVLLIFSVTHINFQEKNDLYVLEISNIISEYSQSTKKSNVNIFSGDGNYCVYVNNPCKLNPSLGNSDDYSRYIKSNKIDVIILSERLLKSYSVMNPTGPELLVKDIKELDYIKIKSIWGTDIYVLDN